MDAPLSPAPASPASAGHFYRRLAAPLRVALYLAACLTTSLAWCLLLLVVFRPGLDIFTFPDRYPLAASLYMGGTYVILVGGALVAWLKLQGETLRAIGLVADRPWRWLGGGLLLGFGSLGLLFLGEVLSGLLLWDAAAWGRTGWPLLAANGLTALFFGFSEELLFRGFIFQTLRRGLALPVAIGITSWLYAQVHFLRFDLHWHTVAMPFFGLFLAGWALAWGAHRTGSIWLSVGLHSAWVYVFFLTDRQKLLVYPIQHNWLTGGGYPLAGWLAIAMLLALGFGLRGGITKS